MLAGYKKLCELRSIEYTLLGYWMLTENIQATEV